MAQRIEIRSDYKPHPQQAKFHTSGANVVLYGGAVGGGKSKAILEDAKGWCERVPGLQAFIFRRTFPELKKNHIRHSLLTFDDRVWSYNMGDHLWTFLGNGSTLQFAHCDKLDDWRKYKSDEINLLYMDELTTFEEQQILGLITRNRCSMNVSGKPKNGNPSVTKEDYSHKIPGFYAATNPGDISHQFVKGWFIDGKEPEVIYPVETSKQPNGDYAKFQQFIPARMVDNPSLTENDPGYISNLMMGMDEDEQKAMIDGSWELFAGQAWHLTSRHIVDPHDVPRNAPLFMTMDWGTSAPFAIQWWYADSDSRVTMFREWYNWDGRGHGLPMKTEEVAEGVIAREREWGISLRDIYRFAGHDAFNHSRGHNQAEAGESVADVFARTGLALSPVRPDRGEKFRLFRDRMLLPKDETAPLLQVTTDCRHFIRTIPTLQKKPGADDIIDKNAEDHCYDAACQMCLAQPTYASEERAEGRADFCNYTDPSMVAIDGAFSGGAIS